MSILVKVKNSAFGLFLLVNINVVAMDVSLLDKQEKTLLFKQQRKKEECVLAKMLSYDLQRDEVLGFFRMDEDIRVYSNDINASYEKVAQDPVRSEKNIIDNKKDDTIVSIVSFEKKIRLTPTQNDIDKGNIYVVYKNGQKKK